MIGRDCAASPNHSGKTSLMAQRWGTKRGIHSLYRCYSSDTYGSRPHRLRFGVHRALVWFLPRGDRKVAWPDPPPV